MGRMRWQSFPGLRRRASGDELQTTLDEIIDQSASRLGGLRDEQLLSELD